MYKQSFCLLLPTIRKRIKANMQENLVIVESPAKAKTIEKFLGSEYKVMSSYGHIRDLKRKELSLDSKTLAPEYEIPTEKKQVVSELKSNAAKAKTVWLASDEDREGEAISWHLCEVLGLDEKKTNRIVFHEITKPAILKAIESPRHLDMNLVNAQQARRVLDRIVGFRLSPVLWRKVKPALSAGRVQSVAVRLIVEREREIQAFSSEPYYRINAVFSAIDENGKENEIKAELNTRFTTHADALAFLEKCKNETFTIADIQKKPTKRSPAPPFTTSTLQQEAARKLGFTVSQTMMVAQRLYEAGRITYMRTDSVNLSSLCINAAKDEVAKLYGEEYCKPRNYHTHSKGAQEAHEAIRPTYMENVEISGNPQEKRLYDLIWKRTAASQMEDAQIEKTTINIKIGNEDVQFVASGEVVTFDGFLKVYIESTDDEIENGEEDTNRLPKFNVGDVVTRKEIISTERFSQAPIRYTEASLVRKLEELGIGRPCTYAPTISTIQQREYVHKGDKGGEERPYIINVLSDNGIKEEKKVEMAGSEKGKLIPTDIGTVVNDFLMENFPQIMDYNFTANVEQKFDDIAEGRTDWLNMMTTFDKDFEPKVKEVMDARSEHKVGERELGNDPKTGKPVFVKIGRFGPVVQVGTADDDEKPRFAQIPTDKSIETITLEEALDLFKLPRTLGQFEKMDVIIGAGRFGPYVLHNKKYTSLPKDADPMTITLDGAIRLIEEKRLKDRKRHLKTFEEDEKMEILNGRYGPYIAYDGKNYRLPKAKHAEAESLSYEECLEIIKAEQEKPKRKTRKS
jgi:DNA topoisomerase-1